MEEQLSYLLGGLVARKSVLSLLYPRFDSQSRNTVSTFD